MDGLSAKQVAEELGISENMVSILLRKFGISMRGLLVQKHVNLMRDYIEKENAFQDDESFNTEKFSFNDNGDFTREAYKIDYFDDSPMEKKYIVTKQQMVDIFDRGFDQGRASVSLPHVSTDDVIAFLNTRGEDT